MSTARPRPSRIRRRRGLYQFKITLLESEPPIWRRIQVKDGTLNKLHGHIQTAMGWTNSHLHQFETNGVIHGDRVELEGVTTITNRGMGQSMFILKELRRKDAQGRFVRRSAEGLAEAIGALGGVGTITGSIQTLRQNATTRLKKNVVAVGREDVISHDEHGYSCAIGSRSPRRTPGPSPFPKRHPNPI